MIASIKVPILATIGDIGEYTIIPITDAISILQQSNAQVEVHQMLNCNHCYKDHERELVNIIGNFIHSIKL